MLLYAVLVAALTHGLACPCPPAPAASEVCGSDLVTYDSLCHLQCAAVPGLSPKHPGPCPEDADSAAQQPGRREQNRRRRSVDEEGQKWNDCTDERECWEATDCGCGEDDKDCTRMCRKNCVCACGGYPRGGMDFGLWGECYDRRCVDMRDKCDTRCKGEEECDAECALDDDKCGCGCVQRAQPAPQSKLKLEACLVRDQCAHSTCSECQGADPICAKRCAKRCQCECAGYPRRDLSGEWEECFIGTQSCEEAHRACAKECHEQKCRDKCYIALVDCSCECRSANEEELRMWDKCEKANQCDDASDCGCSTDGLADDGGYYCTDMCQKNCVCGCGGYPRGGMDFGLWEECYDWRRCWMMDYQCKEGCGGVEECEAACALDHAKCTCACVQRAQAAPQSKLKWEGCLVRDQCAHRTCSECQGADPICAKRCAKRCQCECAGYPRRDLSGEWEECFIGTQSCEEAHKACAKKCHEGDCRNACQMAFMDCSCVCLSATDAEWLMWDGCKFKNQLGCVNKRCSDCREGDTDCAQRCQHNCECGCLGINADSLDISVLQCLIDNGCQTQRENCLQLCETVKRKECEHSCILAMERCYCECARSRPTKLLESEDRVKIIMHCNFIC